jgi:hypothetical protein
MVRFELQPAASGKAEFVRMDFPTHRGVGEFHASDEADEIGHGAG